MNEMNEQLIEALDAWEAGDLAAEELVARHPEAAAIFSVHQQLWALTHEPTPDPERGLATVRRRIAEPRSTARPRRVSKAIVAALIAAALTGSAAIAAPGAVRSIVDGVRHGIERIFGSDEAGGAGKNESPPSSSAPALGASTGSGDSNEGNAHGDDENPGATDNEQGSSGSGGNEGDQGSHGDEDASGNQGDQDENGDQGDQGQNGNEQGGPGKEQGGSGNEQSEGGGHGQGQGQGQGQGGGQDEGGSQGGNSDQQ